MRKITVKLVWLFVVFVIYFGYSAFVDGVAVYHLTHKMEIYDATGTLVGSFTSGILMGSSEWAKTGIIYLNGQFVLPAGFYATIGDSTEHITNLSEYIGGFMAPTSLLYTILTPFKLVLVGGVFATLIPLTKSIFFGTFIGIKDYIKNRRANLLFNYQKAINFTVNLKSKLELGDYEQVKAQYGDYGGLAFKPAYLQTMMDEIADTLIRERSLKIFIKPCQIVITSLKEMYEKERRTAISQHPDEMFFDFKMGYDYVSIGSKYSIAYYKSIDTKATTPMRLAWKLFSLEMFRFYIYMLLAIIPTIIINIIIIPLISRFGGGDAGSMAAPSTIIVSFFLIAIILHACFTLTKSSYRHMQREIWVPAVIYYLLIIILALTLSLGINGVQNVGSIVAPGTAISMMWPFFAALGYAILSTCLVLYIIATLMDANRTPGGMTTKLMVDGIILPAIAWLASTGANFIGVLADLNMGLWSGIAFLIVCVFWIYLSISGLLLNNIVFPSKKQKLINEKRLAREGLAAKDKQDQQTSSHDKK
ncbi:hypothetical protein JN01_0182 [Entomoplasma freundtii]|uniref:Uncharacterized protein n=1 Tax=Entomoplasma freundtii TaxID=74700 RepID=A0A2K8NRY4_9MOLU|nr:hypothetical protein [Entomoplasma freundtii]ATZ16605.1 hypothetical protein EFREU_v1c05850 [Entomoplasma freundtii]TDY58228.1 hypothetical protein JN01_0182 [Entomoplasma freundtii]